MLKKGIKLPWLPEMERGKSTLLRIITGLDTADTGSVWVHKEVKVIMLQQETAFDEEKSIWDNILRLDNPVIKTVKEYEIFLEEGKQDDDHLTDLIARLDEYNAWNFESDLKQILGKLNLHHLNEPVRNLSGGQRKRVALAQALVEADLHEGKCLLILDEPTNHLDVSMIEWLEDYLSAKKLTLLLVTHDRYF
jgi:ATP-binding cassette subfamily F protein uup